MDISKMFMKALSRAPAQRRNEPLPERGSKGYEHNLSKRTQLYIVGAYDYSKIDINMVEFSVIKNVTRQVKMKTFEAVADLIHKF